MLKWFGFLFLCLLLTCLMARIDFGRRWVKALNLQTILLGMIGSSALLFWLFLFLKSFFEP